jgi:hypothetical protein
VCAAVSSFDQTNVVPAAIRKIWIGVYGC